MSPWEISVYTFEFDRKEAFSPKESFPLPPRFSSRSLIAITVIITEQNSWSDRDKLFSCAPIVSPRCSNRVTSLERIRPKWGILGRIVLLFSHGKCGSWRGWVRQFRINRGSYRLGSEAKTERVKRGDRERRRNCCCVPHFPSSCNGLFVALSPKQHPCWQSWIVSFFLQMQRNWKISRILIWRFQRGYFCIITMLRTKVETRSHNKEYIVPKSFGFPDRVF